MNLMGLGPPVIELYRQLKLQGALDGITEVMELGSQDFWCPQKNLVTALVKAFGKEVEDPALLNTSNASQKPARMLYEALGMKYDCVDVDGRVGSVVIDLNFDPVPPEHKSKYGLVTNHGTSEHILNQFNVFKSMHDFARPGAVFIHAVPFTVHLEHGFFNYQPNFFEALARYNSYETLGIWVGPDWQLASFVPWDPMLLDFLTLSAKTTHLLVVAQRKMYEKEFCVPFQEIYEDMVPDEVRSRYAMVVDGEVMDSKRVKYLTKDAVLAKDYLTQIMGLNNWIDAYKGQIDGLKHELAVTKYQFDQLRYGMLPRDIDTLVDAHNKQEIDRLKNELNAYKDQVDAYKGQIDEYRSQLDEYKGQADEYKGQADEYKGQIDGLKNEVAITKCQLENKSAVADIPGQELATELARRVRRRLGMKI
jgi:predicted  nucleic acid-binding Zn-ribbon protein